MASCVELGIPPDTFMDSMDYDDAVRLAQVLDGRKAKDIEAANKARTQDITAIIKSIGAVQQSVNHLANSISRAFR